MFKTTLVAFVSVLVLGACNNSHEVAQQANNWQAEEPAYTTDNFEASKSAVQLMLRDGGYCSGVVVSSTHILTAAHCTYTGVKSIVELPEARIFSAQPHLLKDISVITVNSTGNIPAAKFAAYEPERNDNLYLVGYGCNGYREVRKVVYEHPVLSGFDLRDADLIPVGENPHPELQLDYKTSGCTCKGDSGSAVFDSSGGVVAIHSASDATENGMCSTINLEISVENLHIGFNYVDNSKLPSNNR